MKTMKAWPVVLLLLLAAVSTASAQTGPRIAVFDPQRLSAETEEGARIQARLTALQQKKRGELEALQKTLTDLQNQFTTQALSLSPERKQALEMEIQKKALEFQGAQEAAGRELQLEINNAQTNFQEQLLAVVEQYGTAEGFDLILDRSLVAWASPTMDVTTALVDRFNELIRREAAGQPEEPGDGQ